NLLTGLARNTPRQEQIWSRLFGTTSATSEQGGCMGVVHGVRGRDVAAIVMPSWGAVVAADGVVPWLVVDPAGVPVEPVRRFLTDFVARGYRPGSVRSYAYGLLRWWRWLQAVGIEWDQATSEEARDLVLWLKQAAKPRRSPRTLSTATAGTINPITRKQYLNDQYKPRTVRHSNAVVRSFYEFYLEIGEGPLVNPVPREHGRNHRPNEHHNPLEPFRPEGRVRYNPKVPKQKPRAMPDEQWKELFAALRSNRDRAIVAASVSNGARATELLGVRSADLDWGEQLVRVFRKGTQAEQWLPASPEAFVWLRLYLAELGDPLSPDQPLWQTLRRRDRGDGLRRQPLNYEALRAVFRRVNTLLGTNWSMHDLRHTAAIRMSRDEKLSLRDVQAILGHAHLSTTADVYMLEDDAEVVRRVHLHLANQHAQPQIPPVTAGYNDRDLAVLFGGGLR
ncbi:site-specific integrase, partial [Saccharopolyspora sp. 6V]|uniref:tyrosine-type recombinase/integrase n=1 Tax=Saccharopolyspora sp. 6V TaxID=2877239 RepID=UPI001CD7D792